MQAIIMAAGKGSRLGELTREIPKAFLEVHGYKLIEYNIAMLHAFHIHDISIVTGYRSELFEKMAAEVEGVRCIFNPFYEMTNVLGSFYMGQDVLREDFVYLHADTICSAKIFRDMIDGKGDLVLPVDFRHCDEEAMKVRTEGGKVVEINKTMDCGNAEGEFIGIAKISANALSGLKDASKELMKEKAFSAYFEAAVQRLIETGNYHINTTAVNGLFWAEVDFLEDYNFVKEQMPEELIEAVKREFAV